MGRTASGRMITQDIAGSAKVASLSPEALALFCLLIPHYNAHGKMLANSHAIKGIVCPLIEWLTVEKIAECLAEISDKTNVKWWRDAKGLHYLHSLNWREHQELRADRLGVDRLPDYSGENSIKTPSPRTTPGALRDHSGVCPGPLPHEVEEEVEEKEKGKGKPSSDALRLSGLLADLIAANNPGNRTVQPNVREKSIERWAEDVDRMFRLDGRGPHEVEKVIRWSQRDAFWCANILSGSKLRQQFDKLTVQMQGEKQKGRSSADVALIERKVY